MIVVPDDLPSGNEWAALDRSTHLGEGATNRSPYVRLNWEFRLPKARQPSVDNPTMIDLAEQLAITE